MGGLVIEVVRRVEDVVANQGREGDGGIVRRSAGMRRTGRRWRWRGCRGTSGLRQAASLLLIAGDVNAGERMVDVVLPVEHVPKGEGGIVRRSAGMRRTG